MRKMILRSILMAAFLLPALLPALLSSLAQANPDIASRYMPKVKIVGKGRMTYYFWNVYDAIPYASDGKWQSNKPYALSLSYRRSLSGKDIARRSIEEIRDQGFTNESKITIWYQKMKRLFPDVNETITLTGIRDANGHAIFYQNSSRIGAIRDPEFSDWFFGIWLNEKTSEPGLRKKLLGLSRR